MMRNLSAVKLLLAGLIRPPVPGDLAKTLFSDLLTISGLPSFVEPMGGSSLSVCEYCKHASLGVPSIYRI